MCELIDNRNPERTIFPESMMDGGLLHRLLRMSVVHQQDWSDLRPSYREDLSRAQRIDDLVAELLKHRLITTYQAQKIHDGQHSELVIGGYRILSSLGRGGMGTVYKVEHLQIRRHAALKLVHFQSGDQSLESQRFSEEIRDIANLQHPNIVGIFDAGEIPDVDLVGSRSQYYVMEFIDGQSLHQHALSNPMSPEDACEIIYLIAGALAEAHELDLVHRDIKPANIMIEKKGTAKLLDFGIAHHAKKRLTFPGVPIGTLAFMAPEQAQDASSVDVRADVFALGATLFFALTGREPFLVTGNLSQALMKRVNTNEIPRVRSVRSDISVELDEVVARMMAFLPENRYVSASAVQRALLPFLNVSMLPGIELRKNRLGRGNVAVKSRSERVLVVDDEPHIRDLCQHFLESANINCCSAADAAEALSMLAEQEHDLVVLDVDMPGKNGIELCQTLRENPRTSHLKIMMLSGGVSGDRLAEMLLLGADDFMTKPFSRSQYLARIRALLRLKSAQDRSEQFHRELRMSARALEQALNARDIDLIHARNSLVLALARLAEYRDNETGAHLLRLQHYSRCLGQEAIRAGVYRDVIDDEFVEMLCCCAPLHDIGKVAIPDHILHKPGKLDPVERAALETHTIVGSDMLRDVAKQNGFAVAFLNLAADVARHHHEKFDGSGYPDGLVGNDIPLAARVVAIVDVYDALRSRRAYKPAFTHERAMEMMHTQFPSHFDPALINLFDNCDDRIRIIYSDFGD